MVVMDTQKSVFWHSELFDIEESVAIEEDQLGLVENQVVDERQTVILEGMETLQVEESEID